MLFSALLLFFLYMTDLKNVEVELRAELDEQGYARLQTYCEAHGKLLRRENRFFVDYSPFLGGTFEDRRLDVRARVTNGQVQIVVKHGEFGGAARVEGIMEVTGSIGSVLQVMAMLGYQKGIACDRGIARYVLDNGMEIAVQDVRVYGKKDVLFGRFCEAELMADPANAAKAEERLRGFFQELGLVVFEKAEWYEYVRRMNEEANGVFDLDKNDISLVEGLGQVPN